jgi:hypothetical protein
MERKGNDQDHLRVADRTEPKTFQKGRRERLAIKYAAWLVYKASPCRGSNQDPRLQRSVNKVFQSFHTAPVISPSGQLITTPHCHGRMS